MPIFCQKNAHSSKNTVLTSHFFLMFHEKPPADVPIFNLKNVNSVKTILYYGPKKSVEYHYFPIFHEKITALMSILCQKNINFLKKNTLSQAHILWKKAFFLSKTWCSHSIFVNFLVKTSFCHTHNWKKSQFCHNYFIL